MSCACGGFVACRSRLARAVVSGLCVLGLCVLALSACDPDDEPASSALPEIDPLQSAREALDERDWDVAIQLATLSIESEREVAKAREIIETAQAEKQNRARLASARSLFNAEQYAKAYVELLDYPDDSVYATHAANMLIRIRQAVVLPELVTRRDGATMRRVLVGSFKRGTSDKEARRALALCEEHAPLCQARWFDREKPRRRHIVGSFYIDTQEVSVAQYRACVAAGVCRAARWSKCVKEEDRPRFDRPELPQVCIRWQDAEAYCTWVGARLPTEAEWERAAGGPRSTRFPWGRKFDAAAANWGDGGGEQDGYHELAPVDAFPPAVHGLRNLAGNAYEWVADWYADDYYADAPELNPTGPASTDKRVIRGGAFNSAPSSLRAAHRNRMVPSDIDRTVGFRCAASPTSLPPQSVTQQVRPPETPPD